MYENVFKQRLFEYHLTEGISAT